MDEGKVWTENYTHILKAMKVFVQGSHHDAEDVLSAVSPDLLLGIRKYDPSKGMSMRNYLIMIAKRRARTYMQSTDAITGRRSESNQESTMASLAVEEPIEDDEYSQHIGEIAETVRSIVESLSEESREIVRLLKDGWGAMRIQQALKISAAQLKSKRDAIKNEIIKVLEEDGIEYERFVGTQKRIRTIFDM